MNVSIAELVSLSAQTRPYTKVQTIGATMTALVYKGKLFYLMVNKLMRMKHKSPLVMNIIL